MRRQLEVDLQANLNLDAADVVKDLMEKYNQLVADYNSLVALLEANKADITAVDFASEASTATINID